MPTIRPNEEIEKERMIRGELHNLGEVGVRVCMWGVTVLVFLQTSIFFLRKDIYDRMLQSGELTAKQSLPFDRYIIGTAYLTLVALIFFGMSMLVSKHYRFYYRLLSDDAKKLVPVPPLTNTGRWLILFLYFIFPLFDLLVKVWVRFKLGLS